MIDLCSSNGIETVSERITGVTDLFKLVGPLQRPKREDDELYPTRICYNECPFVVMVSRMS